LPVKLNKLGETANEKGVWH